MNSRIDTEIEINAPAKIVWKILVTLEEYKNWNPFIRRASGTIALDNTIVVEPKLHGSRRLLKFSPRVSRYQPEVEFGWIGEVIHPSISAGEHVFQIERLGPNRVKLKHFEIFLGITAPLVMLVGGEKTKKGFELMNEAVKDVAENRPS